MKKQTLDTDSLASSLLLLWPSAGYLTSLTPVKQATYLRHQLWAESLLGVSHCSGLTVTVIEIKVLMNSVKGGRGSDETVQVNKILNSEKGKVMGK